jgi:hypothetical protein
MSGFLGSEASVAKSRVVVIKSSGVIDSSGKVDSYVLETMVGQGLSFLTSESTSEEALRRYFKLQDKVGLKVNCLAGPLASTHPEVSSAVVSLLKKAGFKPGNIIIWDRSSWELKEVGFPVNVDGNDVLCFGTDNQGVAV